MQVEIGIVIGMAVDTTTTMVGIVKVHGRVEIPVLIVIIRIGQTIHSDQDTNKDTVVEQFATIIISVSNHMETVRFSSENISSKMIIIYYSLSGGGSRRY
jgi:hypothetical protein